MIWLVKFWAVCALLSILIYFAVSDVAKTTRRFSMNDALFLILGGPVALVLVVTAVASGVLAWWKGRRGDDEL